MSGDTVNTQGSLETRDDATMGEARMWLDAIDLAGREEKDWREFAADAVLEYRDGKRKAAARGVTAARRFNILFSNTETLAPALYNAPPIPDVRRRFGDSDEQGKVAAQVLERALSYSLDEGDEFGDAMAGVVKDVLLTGRGISRVKYVPIFDATQQQLVHQQVEVELVAWEDFRHGPAKRWKHVPWIAFRHRMTREELTRLSPKIGPRMELDAQVEGLGQNEAGRMRDGSPPPDMFKRGTVWEVWDREKREVLFVAEAWPDDVLARVDDPLSLERFFPIPKPVYAVETTDTLVPVEPYRLYKDLAHELNVVTRRIAALTNALRWRGAYIDPQMGDFLARFKDLDDGEMAPLDNPAQVLNGGALDKAFWFMPIEQCAAVLERLYLSREQIKQTIYEVTGISDILRGVSQASETLGAQQIKTQWGSLRIQKLQADVARHARDLLRLQAEIIAEKFDPAILSMMTGIQVTEDVAALLRNDAMRRYRVDIETDSTIRADTLRQQENIGQFVQGFGTFIQAVGPAVQAGALPMPVVTAMLKGFSRAFKLGREVEDAIESIPAQAPQQPGADAAAQRAAAEAERQAQAEAERLAVEQRRHEDNMALEQRKHDDAMALEREKLELQRQTQEREMSLKDRDVALRERPAVQEDRTEATLAGMEMMAGQLAASVGQAQQVAAALAQQVRDVAAMATAPREIIRGPDGRAAGVRIGNIMRTITRGPDGRAAGLQ